MKGLIYTLGTGTRSFAEFIALVRGHRLESVADVRRFPSSRLEHFRRQAFSELLTAAGCNYVYLGAELGGYRKGGYPAYMETGEFQRGIAQLEGLASTSRTAIVCAERLPWRCHRRFIGRALQGRGWRVVHIVDDKRVWEPGQPASQEA
ncbi:MAG TPA: DUF488 domain-containing protein [Dehalococcoidia bacterium]|nr:DUF488 domain-containing protein [Dehalococcoidia bacterium]